jgi:hypothetical protein
MPDAPSICEVVFELGQFLRREIWQQFHWMKGIFHLLPPAAAVILLLLLSDVGQIREIYLSYLEDLDAVQIILALAGCALISATLYESHYWLSTMRVNVVYSNLSNPNVGSNLRLLQRVAAFALSLFPWAGLAAGLIFTKFHLVTIHNRLIEATGDLQDPADTNELLALPTVGHWGIVLSIILLGLVVGKLFDSYRKSRIVQGAIILLTPSAVAAVFALLTGHCSPNVHSAGCPDAKHLAQALIAVTVIFCGVHYFLDTKRIIFVYSSFWHRHEGINLRRRQRLVTFFWALSPWIVLGLLFANDRPLPEWIALKLPGFVRSTSALPATYDWPIISVAVVCVVSVGLLVAFTMDAVRENKWTGRIVASAVFIAIVIVAVMPVLNQDIIRDVWDFRWVGPLGAITLACLFIFSIFALMALLSEKSGFPALLLALTAVILSVLFHIPIATMAEWSCGACVLLTVLAFVSRLWFVGFVTGLLALLALLTIGHDQRYYPDANETDAGKESPPLITVMSVEEHFREWIQKRKDRTQGDGDPNNPYPVFIISAEGGGIYAAAAASMFLAKLQDDCPYFAQHVFAISGVSGGAIGATIFKSLSELSPAPSDPEASQAGCPLLKIKRPMTEAVKKIMEQDHFSPVVLSIIPEFLGGIIPKFLGGHIRREEALEGSFEDNDAAERLKAPFLAAWPNDSSTPRLVLNTTWAETGYRVAFAPFTMGSSQGKDGTLYSFADSFGSITPRENAVRLMEAAVASARFPGILPPFTVKMPVTAGMPGDHWWNFVDGGYADSSGAATALALFNALEPESCKVNVDLKVILLTSSNPPPNFQNLKGSEFRDTMTPVEAVMRVRDLLGKQAVTRASDHFNPSVLCQPPQFKPEWQFDQIRLEDQEYSLSLGWKISHTTFKLVSYLIGQPGSGPCPPPTSPQSPAPSGPSDPSQSSALSGKQHKETLNEEKALQANRCVMRLVEQALSGNWLQKPGDHPN